MRPSTRCSAVLVTLLSISACTSSHRAEDAGPAGRDAGPIDRDGGPGGGDAGLTGACSVPSDCVVTSVSCCGSCGAATRGDAVAIARSELSAHQAAACGSGTIGCPGCYMPQDPTLVATCTAGRCELIDLHEHDAARCTADGDCRLRTQACCECGGDTSIEGLIAIRVDAEAAYSSVVCDPGTGCPECAPIYPAEAAAACAPGGWCEVLWASGI